MIARSEIGGKTAIHGTQICGQSHKKTVPDRNNIREAEMILYYTVLPGGERLFVDPAEGKLEISDEFKNSFSYENPGTDQEWLDDFLAEQEEFLEWAKERIAAYREPEGECGCYDFGEIELRLIKEDITIEGEHRSCVVFNKKETDRPVNGIGTMEEWDEDGRISIRRKGFIVDGKLQGWGEKIDFSGNDCGGYIYRGEFKDDRLNGEGRFMSNYWAPTLDEKQLYLFSDWIEFCLDPNTTPYQIMDPLRFNDERTFSAVQGGTFKNDELYGEGFYFWGMADEEYGIAMGNFDGNYAVRGLDISYEFRRADARIVIKEGDTAGEVLNGKGCIALLDPLEKEFNADDLFPFMRREKSIRECMLDNEHFVPKNYQEGNFDQNELNGHGIEVNYRLAYIHSGPALENGVYEGEFLYDMQHGYGEYKSDDLKYRGNFFANEFHGFGRKISHYYNNVENGVNVNYALYTGEFVCDLCHGHGQLVKFYQDGSAKVYEGNFAAGRLEDGVHTVKMYSGFSEEEISGILESGGDGPVTFPEEKFTGTVEVKYLHGRKSGQ